MKTKLINTIILAWLVFPALAGSWIRINQLGYLPNSVKVAVMISEEEQKTGTFQLCDALTNKVVFTGTAKAYDATGWGMKSAFRLDFSAFTGKGGYYLQYNKTQSPCFRIDTDVYRGTADYILKYMRQQRCGYNPFLNDSCHKRDGIIVDHPQKTGQWIDVTGGWHDASDYLQYLTTSANAAYQMLFAYLNNPEVYGDEYDAMGRKGKNNIPDILDEVKWGLDWMVKMNPAPGEMYNQIADDRDHRGFRLPNLDTTSYGLGKMYRPVYFITGKQQGLAKHKNRSTGVSSSAAKYASTFALGSQILKKYYPEFSEKIATKAVDAYQFALSDLGACQTACNVSPYFYEEDNFVDDLELAACELHRLTGEKYYSDEAAKWGSVEQVTPWMSTGFARHYQFYPFVNLGHYYLAEKQPAFTGYMKNGLQYIYDRAKSDPFLNGVPFIWCSNNLVAAAVTQARCYEKAANDKTYAEMEASLRDWLFGCNPWGTSMICGLPAGGDNPQIPHSAITLHLKEPTYGGLIDGPVYTSIYKGLLGIRLMNQDSYAPFQNGKAVYHDDMGDYSSNEPTMDGTASLSFYLSSLEKEGMEQEQFVRDGEGAIVRLNPSEKTIYLAFTADDKADGGEHILNVLDENNIKASFFFTGNFLRNAKFSKLIKSIVNGGHYVGPHSDGHLLYCDWKKRDSLLVDRTKFEDDLRKNYGALQKFSITPEAARWFMPPYEWYNKVTVDWAEAMGLQVVNFTPGVRTAADYTTPNMKSYKSSDELIKSLYQFEKENSNGLNGCIILIHPGTEASRTDKLYARLGEIINYLKEKNYTFKRL